MSRVNRQVDAAGGQKVSATTTARLPEPVSWFDRLPHDLKLLIIKRCFELDNEEDEIARCGSTEEGFNRSRIGGLFTLNREWSALAAPYRFYSLSSAHLRNPHFRPVHLDRRGALVRNFSLSPPTSSVDELESELGLIVENLRGLVRLVLPEKLVMACNGTGFNGHQHRKIAEGAPLRHYLAELVTRCRHLILVAESVSDAFVFLHGVLPRQNAVIPLQTLTLVCGDMLAWRDGPATLQQAVSQAAPGLANLERIEVYTARTFQAEAWPDLFAYGNLAEIVVSRHRGRGGYAYYWVRDRQELARHLVLSSGPTFQGCASVEILEKTVHNV